ncbi:hypothetical protein EDB84DRAFT_1020417 [Lactarius hengduanensis]|nr:hypothetical protein EDB84DRAFT_1020417 [Lactarius hengduanensis]
MPRARDPIFREHFTNVERLKWRCNICVGSCGGRGRTMTRKQAMFHEVSKGHSSKVAATFFRHPGNFRVFMHKGDLKWHCQICKGGNAMSVKKAVAHEVQCHGGRNGNTTSMHREGTVFERNDDDDDNDDNDNDDDNGDDGDNAASGNGKEVDKLLSSQWWADLSARNVASWREGPEAAERDSAAGAGSSHGLLDDRSEADGNTTSVQEGTIFEHNDSDNDDDNNGNDAVIVENFRRCNVVDASSRERSERM